MKAMRLALFSILMAYSYSSYAYETIIVQITNDTNEVCKLKTKEISNNSGLLNLIDSILPNEVVTASITSHHRNNLKLSFSYECSEAEFGLSVEIKGRFFRANKIMAELYPENRDSCLLEVKNGSNRKKLPGLINLTFDLPDEH